MITSGTSATTTNSASAVNLLSLPAGIYHFIGIINEGTTAGFFSFDRGSTWARLPAGATGAASTIKVSGPIGLAQNTTLSIKRDSSDLTGIFAFAIPDMSRVQV